MSEELACRDCGLPKANATELCDTFVRSDELGAPQPASPPAKPAPADTLALLIEQHAAMSEVMELRRLSSTQWEQRKGERAIAVWRKVEAALSTTQGEA